jgi:acyl carrier protein
VSASDEKLRAIFNLLLKKKGKAERASFTAALSLSKDLGLDSLDLAELTVRVEDEFGIDLFEKGVIRTVGEVRARLNLPPEG